MGITRSVKRQPYVGRSNHFILLLREGEPRRFHPKISMISQRKPNGTQRSAESIRTESNGYTASRIIELG